MFHRNSRTSLLGSSRLFHRILVGWVFLLLSALPPVWAGTSLWQAVPLINEKDLDAGHRGGEGCQTIEAFAIDSSGNFLMMATNVGGLYRSLDGGGKWEPANVGFGARGGAALAIDPLNSSRVLAVGANSGHSPVNGLWLSTDQAASWKPVLTKDTKAAETYYESVAFDPSSRRVAAGVTFSAVAYWVGYSDAGGGMWKSEDGGETWREIELTLSDGSVKVDPADGTVYVATALGFYRSTDGGKNFQRMIRGPVLGLDVIATKPHWVYICRPDGIYISNDSGQTFTRANNDGLPTGHKPGLRNLKVSPIDPNQMLVNEDKGSYDRQEHFYSADGGESWRSCRLDSAASFIPTNRRPWLYVWSPTQAGLAWACGGGYVSRSTDGGADFAWDNNGFNGFTCAGFFNFNPHNPRLLLVTSQDTNSAFTDNISADPTTWRYLNVSGKGWGGFNYGGYALSDTLLVAGNSPKWGAPSTLMVSADGGRTWTDTGLVGNRTQTACGDPADSSVAFWDNYRTADGGQTWRPMPDCDGVFTSNSGPSGGGALYGAKGFTVVQSTDHGLSWAPVVTIPSPVLDVACDWKNKRLYIAAGAFYQFDLSAGALEDITHRLAPDNWGFRKVASVAADPADPNVVYAAWHGDHYLSSQAVRRSLDGGLTWTTLTLQPGDKGPDGGLESQCVRVNPVTRWLYSGGSCFGIWRYPPPNPTGGQGDSTSTGKPATFSKNF